MLTDEQEQHGTSSPGPAVGDPDAMDVSQGGVAETEKQDNVKLEDLFQSDDDDDDFPSSAPTNGGGAVPPSSSPPLHAA